MAKYIIEYEIHVGNSVLFHNGDKYQFGIVQDITQMPDIWVEGFEDGKYKRWCLGLDSLEIISGELDSGTRVKVEIAKGEAKYFVHKGDVETPEFKELIYTYFK